MARRKKRSKDSFSNKIKNFLLNSKAMPLVFAFSVIGIMFVLIRMKGVEQDYAFNELEKRVKVQQLQNKELKAKRARHLSMKKLKALADKYDLSEPDEKRIIIID